jgi:hypothetical protein
VPGAQLPPGALVERPASVTPADPAAARLLVEQFEAGVRRAQQPTGPAPAPDPGWTPTPTPGRASTVVLARRVPGATLDRHFDRPRPAPVPASQPAQSPDQARDLIEQFETGVRQAMRDARPDHPNGEGSPR